MRQSSAPQGTLSRQLVWRTTGLVAAVTVGLSAVTALANFQILSVELDQRLAVAAVRAPMRGGQSGDPGDRSDLAGSGLIRIDLAAGIAVISAAPVATLPQTEVARLLAVPPGRPTNLNIEGLGSYRALARQMGNRTIVVALPYSEVSAPMGRQLAIAGLLTAAAILLSYFGARRVVTASLRPLTRLAATATSVSTLPLAVGEGRVPVRVDPRDTDPATEVGQVGLALNQMLDNVEGALAARHQSETKLRQFVADASHELRNPLASIRGYAELGIRDAALLPPDTGHALTRIEAESQRMTALVEDLLLLARLDSEPTLDLQETDLTKVVLDAVSDVRAARPNHVWSLRLPEQPVIARVDPRRLHQVMSNLLINAGTHTPPGTTVEAALRVDSGWAVVSVSDNGPGVPEQIRDKVFERFTRADASRARTQDGSSTGLGLAIVAAVVAAHGGRVSLDTRPGHTCFGVHLPLVASPR